MTELICLGLKMLLRDRVVMGCVRFDGGGMMVVGTEGDTGWDAGDTGRAG